MLRTPHVGLILIYMANRIQSSPQEKILDCIDRDLRETNWLEYKREIDLSDRSRKAEFIRDVIALANSDGVGPRETSYLVIGYRQGQFADVSSYKYETSTFGKVIDAYISPELSYDYAEFSNRQSGNFGVLSIQPLDQAFYIVRQELKSDDGRPILVPGQSWGRRVDRKHLLTGDEIQKRLKEILARERDSARKPLMRRIEKLESESGPVLEVRRYRYQLERTRDWQAKQEILEHLHPYAREFDGIVYEEVLSALHEVTERTREGMPGGVATAVCGLLDEMMPLSGGSMNRPASRRITKAERAWLKRIGNLVFEMGWDSCRYLHDLRVVETVSRQYWYLIRFAKLNSLESELQHFLNEAERCQEICLEGGSRKPFIAGHQCMKQAIADALQIF